MLTKEEKEQHAKEAAISLERERQIAALRSIRDDSKATPGERLEAVKLLMEMEGQ